jgi:hypothetical protein
MTPMWRESSAGLCWRRGTGVPLGALDAVASSRPIKGRPDSLEYPGNCGLRGEGSTPVPLPPPVHASVFSG